MADTNLSGVFVLQEVCERILAGLWPLNITLKYYDIRRNSIII
jgi:hypothetical protein